MNDIEILTNIAHLHIMVMAFILMLVLIYATIVIVSVVVLLIKKRKVPESATQLAEAIGDASEKMESNTIATNTITTNTGRVIKFKSPAEREEARKKREKKLLGIE